MMLEMLGLLVNKDYIQNHFKWMLFVIKNLRIDYIWWFIVVYIRVPYAVRSEPINLFI